MSLYCGALVVLLIFAAIVVLIRQVWLDWRASEHGPTIQELYDQHRTGLEAMPQAPRGAPMIADDWDPSRDAGEGGETWQ